MFTIKYEKLEPHPNCQRCNNKLRAMDVIIIYFVLIQNIEICQLITIELLSCLCLFRAAIVDLNSANDAKAAVKDLNGCTLQGHTLRVQQLCGPTSAHPKLNDQPHDTVETIKTEVNRLRTKGASARVSMKHQTFQK